MSGLRVAIVAGEASGDALGAALISALREREPTLQCSGLAGPAMRAVGCEALGDAHELAVMGLIEPLKHLPRLLRLRSMLLARLSAWRPDVFIGVDAPAFNLGLAKHFKAQGVATVQYVSPQVWAWRQGRVRTIARRCDLVLCLLPFEPAFYRDHAVAALFVGHPLADQIAMRPDRAAARIELGLAPDASVIAMLPGSRLAEVRHLAGTYLAAAVMLAHRHPRLHWLAPMASPAVRALFEQMRAQVPGASALSLQVLDGQARLALTAADAALITSGTATLEGLLCRCPMVVAYRAGAFTAWLVRTLRLVRLPYFSLPNLLAGEALAPEFLQRQVSSGNLADALERLLQDPARRAYLESRFAAVHAALRAGGAARAAEAVLQLVGQRRAEGMNT
jgi:lipid-A-disaccharide synthase